MAKTSMWTFSGGFESALRHASEGIPRYSPDRHRSYVARFNQDPGVSILAFAAWSLWFLGYPEQAVARGAACLDLAGKVDHPYSLAMGRGYVSMLHYFGGAADEVERLAEQQISLCDKYGISQWLHMAEFFRGWVRAQRGNLDDGMGQMREALARYRIAGAVLWLPSFLGSLAETCRVNGETEEGFRLLDEADAMVGGEAVLYVAELERIRGDLLLARGETQAADACFVHAAETARQQRAKSLELRCAISRGRLLASQGRAQDARELLRPVYSCFTEGLRTPHLQEAKALLDRLG